MQQLTDLPLKELRRGIIQALVALHGQRPRQTMFGYPEVLNRTLIEIGRPGANWVANNQTTFENTAVGIPTPPNEHPDNPRMLAAVWSLISDGTLIPRFTTGPTMKWGGQAVSISHLSLTPLGEALIRGIPDHPRLSGALDRLAGRHSKMNPDVIARLEDAAMCVDKGLGRPAVLLTGLAVECTLPEVLTTLAQQGQYTRPKAGRTPQASEQITEVENAFKAHKAAYKNDDFNRLLRACGHADMIRVRRNSAAHDPAGTFALDEADELLVLAAGAIDAFYSIIVR